MRQIMGQYRNCLKGRNGEICETGNNKKLNSFTLRECFSYQGEGASGARSISFLCRVKKTEYM